MAEELVDELLARVRSWLRAAWGCRDLCGTENMGGGRGDCIGRRSLVGSMGIPRWELVKWCRRRWWMEQGPNI